MKAAQTRKAGEIRERDISMHVLLDEFKNQLRLGLAQPSAVRCRDTRSIKLEPRKFDRRRQAQRFAVDGIDRTGIDQQHRVRLGLAGPSEGFEVDQFAQRLGAIPAPINGS